MAPPPAPLILSVIMDLFNNQMAHVLFDQAVTAINDPTLFEVDGFSANDGIFQDGPNGITAANGADWPNPIAGEAWSALPGLVAGFLGDAGIVA